MAAAESNLVRAARRIARDFHEIFVQEAKTSSRPGIALRRRTKALDRAFKNAVVKDPGSNKDYVGPKGLRRATTHQSFDPPIVQQSRALV